MSDSGKNPGDCRHGGLKRTCPECKAERVTTQDILLENLAEQLRKSLDMSLTWKTLTPERRERLTRAANAAELALHLIASRSEVRQVTI